MQKQKSQQSQQNQKKLRVIIESAIMISLALVLSEFVPPLYRAPLGGSVTVFSMVPLIIIALKHGVAWGLGSSFVFSATYFILFGAPKLSGWGIAGPYAMIMCALFDYIVAYSILGTAGIFKPAIDKAQTRAKKIATASAATLLACVLRYISHVFVGAVFWYELTKAGGWNDYVNTVGAWVYSAVYNMQYMLPETIITLVAAPAVVTVLSAVSQKRLRSRPTDG